jgi:hypothetical protein
MLVEKEYEYCVGVDFAMAELQTTKKENTTLNDFVLCK